VVDRRIQLAFVDRAQEQLLEPAAYLGVPLGQRPGDSGVIRRAVGERHPDEHHSTALLVQGERP
jgi:hypothetical protein